MRSVATGIFVGNPGAPRGCSVVGDVPPLNEHDGGDCGLVQFVVGQKIV